jgi:hypothetical protein
MRKLLALSAALAAAAVAYQPAAAATPSAESVKQAHAFANCAVTRSRGGEILGAYPGSEAETQILASYRSRGCQGPAATPTLLRGAVAEQLFKTDFGSIGARAKRDSVEVFAPLATGALQQLPADRKQRVEMLDFAACLVATDPTNSVALLNTGVGSAEEGRAMAALQPTFAPCVQAGQTLGVNRAELRGLVAEAAYRAALAHSLRGSR